MVDFGVMMRAWLAGVVRRTVSAKINPTITLFIELIAIAKSAIEKVVRPSSLHLSAPCGLASPSLSLTTIPIF
jgi:hypothetical protein